MTCHCCKRETRRKCGCPQSDAEGYCEPKVYCWCGALLVRTLHDPSPSGLPPLPEEAAR